VSANEDPRRLDLGALLAFWRPRFGLVDWVIVAEYDRTIDGLGVTTVWWRDREARVRIKEPSMTTHEWPPTDVELTFVHELVHCIVEPIAHEARGLPLDLREQVVEQLAKGYVRTARYFPPDPDWLRPPVVAFTVG